MVPTQPPRPGHPRSARAWLRKTRLRTIAQAATAAPRSLTELSELQETAWKSELCLMALRETTPRPLPAGSLAGQRVRMALACYEEHMAEDPRFHRIAQAVHVSPAHLRRNFLTVLGETPHAAFNRLRMEKAERLLHDPALTLEGISSCVGLSSASALSRALKAHFGFTPRQLRSGGFVCRLKQDGVSGSDRENRLR